METTHLPWVIPAWPMCTTLQAQSWNKTSWPERQVSHLWVTHRQPCGVCHLLVSSLGLLPAIAHEISPFGQQHQEQGCQHATLVLRYCYFSKKWYAGHVFSFSDSDSLGHLSLFLRAHLPLCREQPMVESGMIQASVAQSIALRV